MNYIRDNMKVKFLSDSLIWIRQKLAYILEGYQEFNRSEKSYVIGQAFFGIAFIAILTLVPMIVKAIAGDAAYSGIVRGFYFCFIGLSSLFAAQLISTTPLKRMLNGLLFFRLITFFVVGFLFFIGGLNLTALFIIGSIAGILVGINALLDLNSGGLSRIFATSKKQEIGNFICTVSNYFFAITIPLIIGWPIDYLEEQIGPGFGVAIFFILLAILFLASFILFNTHLKVLEENGIKKESFQKKVSNFFITPYKVLKTIPIILENKTVLFQSLLSILARSTNDIIYVVVLPIFALEELNTGALGLGYLLSIANLGILCSLLLLAKFTDIAKKNIGFYRIIFYLSILAFFTFVPSIGLWTSSSLFMVGIFFFAMKLFYTPFISQMESMLQIEIDNFPLGKQHETNFYALLNLFEALVTAAGAFIFGWVFLDSGANTYLENIFGNLAPMKVVTLLLLTVGLIIWFGVNKMKNQMIQVHHSAKESKELKFEELRKNLSSLYIPQYREETVERTISYKRPSIAIMDSPNLNALSLIKEGGKQSPEDVHLILDISWLTQEMQADHRNKLFINKGLYFDYEGNPVIAKYNTPRQINYFVNLSTRGAADDAETLMLEYRLDIPVSGANSLKQITNEKLVTRFVMYKKGVDVPETLAFLMPDHPLYSEIVRNSDPSLKLCLKPFPQKKEGIEANLREVFEEYLKYHPIPEFVIKPSGPAFHSAYGIKFFEREEIDKLIEHIIFLSASPRITSFDSILIDSRITPPPIFLQVKKEKDQQANFCYIAEKEYPMHIMSKDEITEAKLYEQKDWNIRVFVSRTIWNRSKCTGLLVHAGATGEPITASYSYSEKAAMLIQFESAIKALQVQYGLFLKDEEVWKLERDLEKIGVQSFEAISEYEKKRNIGSDEPFLAKTDYLGLDVVLELKSGQVQLKVIETNDNYLGGQYQLDQFYSEKVGKHSIPWIQTMIARSRQNIMKNSRLIILGAGSPSNKFFFDKAKEWGMNTILIDHPDNWAKELTSEFIPIDINDIEKSLVKIKNELAISAYNRGAVEGITTFWEPAVIATAKLARELDLPYHSLESVQSVRNKYKRIELLQSAGLAIPVSFQVRNAHDVENAMAKIKKLLIERNISTFPMIFKSPRGGESSKFYLRVNNLEEIRLVYFQAIENYKKIFREDNRLLAELVFEEFIEGSEWVVDLVMQNSRVIYTAIADHWRIKEPNASNSGFTYPSVDLNLIEQQSCIKLAILSVHSMGFTDGVFHLEGKYHPVKGAYVLEIKPCPMGADSVEWNLAVWGIDLCEMLYATALSIPIVAQKTEFPFTYIVEEFINTHKIGAFKGWSDLDEITRMKGFKKFESLVHDEQILHNQIEGNNIGIISVESQDYNQAKAYLKEIRGKIAFNVV